jgi:hypothetical protein
MAIKVATTYYSAIGSACPLAGLRKKSCVPAADVRSRQVREFVPEEAIASNQGWVVSACFQGRRRGVGSPVDRWTQEFPVNLTIINT